MHTQLIYDVLMSELVAAGRSTSYTYCFPTDTNVIATMFPLPWTSYITGYLSELFCFWKHSLQKRNARRTLQNISLKVSVGCLVTSWRQQDSRKSRHLAAFNQETVIVHTVTPSSFYILCMPCIILIQAIQRVH